MHVEDLVHDLPRAVDLQQVEEVGEAVPGLVLDLDAGRGRGAADFDAGDSRLHVDRGAVAWNALLGTAFSAK